MSGAPAAPGPRQPRRGPAPFASFDHDVSDESSPESKQTFQLPEIREDPPGAAGAGLAPPEPRARSHSSPAAALQPATPRIDISRASSSSHHDSRDSSPEMALFAGTAEEGDARGRLELGFREDGALELRSSTEELAFLEGAPGEPRAPPAPAPVPARRHSRKDSQGSEAALLGVSGRTSRLSSVGSQCSALSGFSHASHVSRLSVVSGVSRSPSPHKMLLETSFCGPKPIEAEPELSGAAVEECLLRLAAEPAEPANTRDRREVRTEVTVENPSVRPPVARALPAPAPVPAPAAAPVARPPPADPPVVVAITPAEEKRQKESTNRARAGRSRERRDSSEPEVYRNRNRSKDIIRIKLKPDSEYEEEEESEVTPPGEARRAPATLELRARSPARAASPAARRTPSPAAAAAGAVSRKSSFCSLFKSRETVASPDSPSGAARRKKSLTEGRARSKSRDRDRSTTPTPAAKIRGSVLSLFKTPRRSVGEPSPTSRAASPGLQAAAPAVTADQARRNAEKLKYYEDTRNGVIHIPLRTPSDELAGPSGEGRAGSEPDARAPDAACEPARPASAPQPLRAERPDAPGSAAPAQKPVHRTVLPDGSIIIPLHSPTERAAPDGVPGTVPAEEPDVVTPDSRRSVVTPDSRRSVVTSESRRSVVTPDSRHMDDSRNGDMRTESSSDEGRAGAPTPPTPAPEGERARRRQRLVFTTHVGSREQVFSTQFSITKTPSVTSEISGSFASCPEPAAPAGSEERPPALRDTHITCAEPARAGSGAASPTGPAGAAGEAPRDSSESEPSSEAATPAARGGSDVEQRGLVVQESFEDELPYVPTTLPLERSLALPMVPVRERAPRVPTAGVRRPRGAALPAGRALAPGPAPPEPPPGEKLRIKLPRRPRTASASAPPRPARPRTSSGGDGDSRAKTEWIDFSEVPERRKQPKRIQTLPAGAAGALDALDALDAPDAGGAVVFSYVEPDQCRCECHAAARLDDELPLLAAPRAASPPTPPTPADQDLSSPEADGACALQLDVQLARPFVADFDLRARGHADPDPLSGRARAGARRH